MHTLSRNQWLTALQSCQAHSCSLFFSLKVWSMSHSYSSTVRAVTDLMCCRKASRLCLGCGKETHTLAGGKRLVCCFVCVRLLCWTSHVWQKTLPVDATAGEETSESAWESDIWRGWPLTVKRACFQCSQWLHISSFVYSKVGKKNVYFWGVFFRCLSLFYCTKHKKKNQFEASEETEAETCPCVRCPCFYLVASLAFLSQINLSFLLPGFSFVFFLFFFYIHQNL